jgi:hypothetical protein
VNQVSVESVELNLTSKMSNTSFPSHKKRQSLDQQSATPRDSPSKSTLESINRNETLVKKQVFESDFKIGKTRKLNPESPLAVESQKPSLFVKIVPIFGVKRQASPD